jgi:hypothetical protein
MRSLFTLLMIGSLMGCSEQRVVSEAELKSYILNPENGLIVTRNKNDVAIDVLYRPSVLVSALQIDGITDKEQRNKTIKQFDSLTYFIIRLSRNGQEIENAFVSDPEKFSKVISYLSSAVAGNIYLTTPNDTLRALDAVYTRMFGAATATSVMVVFDTNAKDLEGTVNLHFDDTELGLGLNEFEFDADNIKKTPTLNLN